MRVEGGVYKSEGSEHLEYSYDVFHVSTIVTDMCDCQHLILICPAWSERESQDATNEQTTEQ